MVALKRSQDAASDLEGPPTKTGQGNDSEAANTAAALLKQSDVLSPALEGPLRDALAACLQSAEDEGAEEERLQALLGAFAGIKKGFPGSALERAVQKRPTLLVEADPQQVQEVLGLLARSCLLPGRVVELVAVNPEVLVDLPPGPLASQIAHLKKATSPMGSQLACLWQKFPQSLWLSTESIDHRLEWLRGLGVPNDRIRFLYARQPVFTAPVYSFQPQLDYLRGLLPKDANASTVGALLAEKSQYLDFPVAKLTKSGDKILAELQQLSGSY